MSATGAALMDDCEEFTVRGYRRRSPLLRLRDSVARLFSPLL
jgi:cardiolipin synthase